MSPPVPFPAKFSDTCGSTARFRARAVSGRLNTRTVAAPSQRNHTGLGSGLPPAPTVVSQSTRSSRRCRITRAPNSVPGSNAQEAVVRHVQLLGRVSHYPVRLRGTLAAPRGVARHGD
jgi:hypothetical protein